MPEIKHYANGTLKLKGSRLDDQLHGAWEWYRADGTVMRTGQFDRGRQIGVWRTFDRSGRLVEQVIGVREPAAALGQIRDLTFEDVDAPAYAKPESNWTWYAGFRPGRPGPGDEVNVFEGADETHAVDGLRLTGFVVNGERLRDEISARSVAGLTIGPHVRNVTFD